MYAGIPFGSVNLLHGVDEHESKAKLLYSPSFKCTFYSIFDLHIATIHFCNSSYAGFPYAIVFIFNLHGSAHSLCRCLNKKMKCIYKLTSSNDNSLLLCNLGQNLKFQF